MKKKNGRLLVLALAVSCVMYGCTPNTSSNEGNQSSSVESDTDSNDQSQSDKENSNGDLATGSDGLQGSQVNLTDSKVVIDKEFTARDIEVGYEESTSTKITLDKAEIKVAGNGATAKDSVVTITEEGTYVVTGSLTDGQIIVAVDDNEKVQIVLDGVTIHCEDQAPIYIKSADKVFITLNKNTVNTLKDSKEYVQIDENTVDGVIYSQADLTINGEGILKIEANYKHGIVSKDEVVITGGVYDITAVKDTINGKDAVKIKDGTFTLSASTGNGIQSKHDSDETKGYVYIAGGDITVTNCEEGIEGTVIIVEGGNINITAKDDGFNASSGISTTSTQSSNTQGATAVQTSVGTSQSVTAAQTSVDTAQSVTAIQTSADTSQSSSTDNQDTMVRNGGKQGGFGGFGGDMSNNTNCYISITGGTVRISASGDGVDSNGAIYISGGELYVDGPTSGGDGAIDYNGSGIVTGGTVVAVGSIGMAEGFSETSTQYSINYSLTSSVAANTEVKLTDGEGNTVIAFTPKKQYQSVVISSPALTEGVTYQLTAGDQTADITISSIVSGNATGGMSFPGGRGGMQGGTMPDFNGEIPEMPDGTMPDFNGEMPELPEGEMPNFNGERPEMPQGGASNKDGTSQDSTTNAIDQSL